MNCKIKVAEKEFFATSFSFEDKLRRFKFAYQHIGAPFLSFLVLDDNSTREYIISSISEFIPDLYSCNIDDHSFEEFDKLVEKQPICLYNLENYFLRLSEEKNISLNEAKELGFEQVGMMLDSVNSKYGVKFLVFLCDEDRRFLTQGAGSFSIYHCSLIDFNEGFIDENGLSLSDYYREEREKKVFKK